jgi:transitional endoplasmic reticulum ATPase
LIISIEAFAMCAELEFKVAETSAEDVGKGWARLDPEDIRALNGVLGDLVEIVGTETTVARIASAFAENCGKKVIQIDGITRSNSRTGLGEVVRVRKINRRNADTVLITPLDFGAALPEPAEVEQFAKLLQGLAVSLGDKIHVPFLGGKERFFKVEATAPSGGVIVSQHTRFLLKKPDYSLDAASHVSYENVGGLEAELKMVREMVELPLRYAEAFERLGIDAPKGVLLCGPPGTGKTLIARAVASETKLHFVRINGPEIIHKFYGESEARLREIFEDATRHAPSVVFIDEIDGIAPKREEVLGDVEKRVVAQLLALMDGMVSRGHVIVIGATNIPDMIDPALRRPGRFDREINLPVPNADGRLHILRIHSRSMPLHANVDLERLSQITHGFVGADLEALCKEAGMVALRRYLSLEGEDSLESVLARAEQLHVHMQDFLNALREIEPTATREFYTERSTVKWDHVGGLNPIKQSLLSAIEWPGKYPDLFEAGRLFPPRGILFSGRSGTGKTLMAKALAGETGINFISISGPILFSKWLGESEKALHQIFKKAKQSAPSIVFFDEIDALVPARSVSGNDGATERVVSQFFNELDSLKDHSQVIVLGATNREDLLDPAVTRAGRLDCILQFPVPDEQERWAILHVHTQDRPLGADVDLEELAKRSDGMVGSQIAAFCRSATMIAISEIINSSNGKASTGLMVTARHFEQAIQELRDKGGPSPC